MVNTLETMLGYRAEVSRLKCIRMLPSRQTKVILTQSKTNSGMWNSHHVNESNVKKHASCQHENPGGDFVHAANSNADHHPAKAENARQNVIEEGHLDGHASLKQYRKISWKENKNATKNMTRFINEFLTGL